MGKPVGDRNMTVSDHSQRTSGSRGKRNPNPFDIIETIAQAPVLLVASDYDGTLAPIVDDPMRAFPRRETMVALKNLAAMPNTPWSLRLFQCLCRVSAMCGKH